MTGAAPRFALDLTTDRLGLPVAGAGVVLGCAPDGAPVQLDVLGPDPQGLVLVGGTYLARQLALRSAAAGLRVVVLTSRPSEWESVLRATRVTDGPADGARVQVRGPHPGPLPTPEVDHPQLVIAGVDVGPLPPPTPRQCVAAMVAHLHPEVGRSVLDATVVLTRRLPPEQARTAADLWRLDAARAHALTSIPDDGVMAFGPDLWQPLHLVTAPLEAALLGPEYE